MIGWVYDQYDELAERIKDAYKTHESRRWFLGGVATTVAAAVIGTEAVSHGPAIKRWWRKIHPRPSASEIQADNALQLIDTLIDAYQNNDTSKIIGLFAAHPELKDAINVAVKVDGTHRLVTELPGDAYLTAMDVLILISDDAGKTKPIMDFLLDNGARPTKSTLSYIDARIPKIEGTETGVLDVIDGDQPQNCVTYLQNLKTELQQKYPNDVKNYQMPPSQGQTTQASR